MIIYFNIFQSLSPGVTLKDKNASVKTTLRTTHENALRTEDIADAILYILGTPPKVQVRMVFWFIILFLNNSNILFWFQVCELTIRSVGELMY